MEGRSPPESPQSSSFTPSKSGGKRPNRDVADDFWNRKKPKVEDTSSFLPATLASLAVGRNQKLTIKFRVLHISEKNNERFFLIRAADETGERIVKAFYEGLGNLMDVKVDLAYSLSGFDVVAKHFDVFRGDAPEVVCLRTSVLKQIEDEWTIPLPFAPTKVDKLEMIADKSFVDVIGTVLKIADYPGKNGKPRRNIFITDDTMKGVELVLWGDDALLDVSKKSTVVLLQVEKNTYSDTPTLYKHALFTRVILKSEEDFAQAYEKSFLDALSSRGMTMEDIDNFE